MVTGLLTGLLTGSFRLFGLFRSKPQSAEEWVGLIRQQEAIHRVTEIKWRQTLNTVSSFLRQTQDSLSDLEKDIEPESDLIRAILQHIKSPGRADQHPPATVSAGKSKSVAEPYSEQESISVTESRLRDESEPQSGQCLGLDLKQQQQDSDKPVPLLESAS